MGRGGEKGKEGKGEEEEAKKEEGEEEGKGEETEGSRTAAIVGLRTQVDVADPGPGAASPSLTLPASAPFSSQG